MEPRGSGVTNTGGALRERAPHTLQADLGKGLEPMPGGPGSSSVVDPGRGGCAALGAQLQWHKHWDRRARVDTAQDPTLPTPHRRRREGTGQRGHSCRWVPPSSAGQCPPPWSIQASADWETAVVTGELTPGL